MSLTHFRNFIYVNDACKHLNIYKKISVRLLLTQIVFSSIPHFKKFIYTSYIYMLGYCKLIMVEHAIGALRFFRVDDQQRCIGREILR